MSDRIEAPAKLNERLKPAQEQIDRLTAQVQAAILGAQLALDVPENWTWDGGGWQAPKSDGVAVADVAD